MNAISIKPLAESQIGAVTALFDAQLREHGIMVSADGLRRTARMVMADPRYGFMLVAGADDGRVVGVAYASTILRLEHGGVSGWLEELYVLPEYRGTGIGSRLLGEVIVQARKLGWRALDLEVDDVHQRVIPFYVRHHFRAHSRARFYRPLGDDLPA
jgi:GNAT superfamily N-acetyltransferase